MASKRFVLFIVFALFSVAAVAQENDDPLAPPPPKRSLIPLDTTIAIRLISRDTVSLDYYSLYAFEYKKDAKKIIAELMIPKTMDKYRHMAMQTVEVKLCKVTQFVNSYMGYAGKPIEVEDYIEITKENGKDKQYYNFDPSVPNVVLTLCEAQPKSGSGK